MLCKALSTIPLTWEVRDNENLHLGSSSGGKEKLEIDVKTLGKVELIGLGNRMDGDEREGGMIFPPFRPVSNWEVTW